MKLQTVRSIAFLVAALMFAVTTGVQAGDHADKEMKAGIGIGDKAPMTEVKMKSVDGKMYSYADVAGEKGTLVIFSCNGCPWVKAWQERVVAIGNAALEEGFGVITINSNDPNKSKVDGFEGMVERAEKQGMKYPYVVDETSEVAKAYGATRTPEAFLFDADGKLVYHGTIDDNAKKPDEVEATYLADAVMAVAKGNKVEMSETKALGCAIKFRSASAEQASANKSDS